ncbi:hypothetical protein [Kitasatospora phosalacinea]|uniref:Uncharacterized protein n=1 Tax=Kitasatospora phosalacinea TaxID=2065 RepID=A0ABW6GVQ0_9ACTN
MQIGSAPFESATASHGPVTCRVGTEEGEALGLSYHLLQGSWPGEFPVR